MLSSEPKSIGCSYEVSGNSPWSLAKFKIRIEGQLRTEVDGIELDFARLFPSQKGKKYKDKGKQKEKIRTAEIRKSGGKAIQLIQKRWERGHATYYWAHPY